MPNTYSQIYLQLVFAVKGRKNLIPKNSKELIHKYISGIVNGKKHKMFAVHCMPDHAHLLVSVNPSESISQLVNTVKTSSTDFIRSNQIVDDKFHWQNGYGVFSYGKSQVDAVVKYINNQEAHHKRKSFKEEYIEFLEKFGIEYDMRYLFEWIE